MEKPPRSAAKRSRFLTESTPTSLDSRVAGGGSVTRQLRSMKSEKKARLQLDLREVALSLKERGGVGHPRSLRNLSIASTGIPSLGSTPLARDASSFVRRGGEGETLIRRL